MKRGIDFVSSSFLFWLASLLVTLCWLLRVGNILVMPAKLFSVLIKTIDFL